MNISCAPQGIVAFQYPKQGIADIAGAGFEQMLLNLAMACPSGNLELIGKLPQKAVKKGKTDLLCEQPEKMCEYMKPVLAQCTG